MSGSGNALHVERSMTGTLTPLSTSKSLHWQLNQKSTRGTRGRACGFVEVAPEYEAGSPFLGSEGDREG